MLKATRRLLFCSAIAVTALVSACAVPVVNSGSPATAAAQASSGTASPASVASDAAALAVAQGQKIKAVALTVDKYCQVGAPFMKSMMLLQTDQKAIDVLTKISGDAGPLCKGAAAIAHSPTGTALPTLNLDAVRTFASNRLPDLLVLVKNSDKLNGDQRAAAELVITGAQAALLMASVNAQ